MKPQTMTEDQVEPELADFLPPRHIVERVSPPGELPPRYSPTALCGEPAEPVADHNGVICQDCVDRQQAIMRAQGGVEL